MSVDLSKKRIIIIHGLASKPPRKDLHALCVRSIIENIRMDRKGLARQLETWPEVFESAYWANATPHHIEDDRPYVRKLGSQVDRVIKERKKVKKKFHVGAGKKAGAFFKNRGIDVVKLFTGALTVKDDVMKAYMRETELYDEDQYIADQMRAPLENALRQAWDEGCDVTILAHSMGTFISYDVLWRFSHRNVSGFKEYRNKSVKMFVTMGSPLGDSTVRGLLFARHHKNHKTRQYPTNIGYWHNYACLGDIVSHQYNFKKEFFDPMREVGLYRRKPTYHLIDYVNLHNPFTVVTHKGNKSKEKRNPHSLYGYLVQPRLGTWLADFLTDRMK